MLSNMTQFDLGAAAFDAGDDHLLFNCTDDFKAGYKEAYMEWAASEYKRAANNPDSSHLEEYWDAHYSEATNGMAQRLLTAISEKPKKATVKGTIHEFLINTLFDTPRKIALMFLAAVIPALLLGSLLFTESEVSAYTAAVLGGK